MAKFKCMVCGELADSLYCFRHKPKKPLKSGRVKRQAEKNIEAVNLMQSFFLEIWKERAHSCQSCGKPLGNEPFTYYFDHLLEKSKYPDLKFKKNNILLCCSNCHTSKTNGHPTEAHQLAINAAKALFLNN